MNYNETYMEHVNHETYDYERAMSEDVENWIDERDGIRQIMIENGLHDRDGLAEYMNDEMWIDDGVTGNASGSYWCNGWKAHAALFNNLDLLHEAIDEFGGEIGKAMDSAESADVTIRCYLLYRVIDDVLDNHETEIQAVIDDFEEIDLDEDETSEESEVM